MGRKKWVIAIYVVACVCFGLALFIGMKMMQARPEFSDTFSHSGLARYSQVGGVAVSDFNSDGTLDVLFAGEAGVRLYKNDGHAHFTDVTKSAGLPTDGVPTATFGDYNNDGCPDVYLTGTDRLFKNNCNGTFSDVTTEAGFKRHADWHSGAAMASWGDYDNDGLLDLYVTNHGIFHYADMEHATYTYDPNILYHNNGDGTFTDITKKAGVSGVSTCGLIPRASQEISEVIGGLKRSFQPVWFDYNNDGLLDLFVATDQGVSPLYQNNGNGTFTEVTKKAGLCRIASNMGVAVGDYNNDGYLDLYVTNGEPNNLWKNNGNGTFTEVAADLGVADSSLTGWGTTFFDYNNDGAVDLYVINGVKIEAGIYSGSTPDRLYENTGGMYQDVAYKAGVRGDDAKEKLAIGDFDGNGFPDILAVTATFEKTDKSRLYMNRGNRNYWITVKLVGTKSNRDGVGATITVVTGSLRQTRLVTEGESFQAQNSLWQGFGLGNNTKIDSVEVTWPGKQVQIIRDAKPDQVLTITQD